jgi:hypothetical protein
VILGSKIYGSDSLPQIRTLLLIPLVRFTSNGPHFIFLATDSSARWRIVPARRRPWPATVNPHQRAQNSTPSGPQSSIRGSKKVGSLTSRDGTEIHNHDAKQIRGGTPNEFLANFVFSLFRCSVHDGAMTCFYRDESMLKSLTGRWYNPGNSAEAVAPRNLVAGEQEEKNRVTR